MELIRKPFIVAALILFATAFAIEAGSRLWIEATVQGVSPANAPRPGLGIPSLAALDILVLLSLVILTLVVVGIPARVVGRIQGIAAVIVSFLGCLGSLTLLLITIGALLLMVGLLVAVPFGTAVYMALFGDFARSRAALTLGAVMLMKLIGVFCLFLGSAQIFKSKLTVLLLACSIGLTFLLTFLHGFPPRVLASITDAIGAIIAFVVAIIWALIFLVSGIISIVRNLRVDRLGSTTVTPRG
jgi:hypothetical protein